MDFEPKVLPTNQFWGRRSGSLKPYGKGIIGKGLCESFTQLQWGCGVSIARKNPTRNERSPNLPAKWFGKDYKRKRGESSFTVKGRKAK